MNDELEEEIGDEDDGPHDDVALSPGASADSHEEVKKYISADVCKLYDVYSYRHAAALLATSFPQELKEIEEALLAFRLTQKIIGFPGGNESEIPKMFSKSLRPKQWQEARITGDLIVRIQRYTEELSKKGKIAKIKLPAEPPRTVENFIDGHKIDYVKGRVAFDLEWNSKDQTFDRDLYAFRAFHETGLISCGVMLTRSKSLNPVFEKVPLLDKKGEPVLHDEGDKIGQPKVVRNKYGASTTWMGKLLYRLNAGRHGSCPVLIFGITPKVISDWP